MVKLTVYFVFLVYFFCYTSSDKNWPQNGIIDLAHLNAKFTYAYKIKKKEENICAPLSMNPTSSHCNESVTPIHRESVFLSKLVRERIASVYLALTNTTRTLHERFVVGSTPTCTRVAWDFVIAVVRSPNRQKSCRKYLIHTVEKNNPINLSVFPTVRLYRVLFARRAFPQRSFCF
jgi:hypothetical protein